MSGMPEIQGWFVWPTSGPDASERLHARMRNVAVSSSPFLHADSVDELREKIEAAEKDNPSLAKLNLSGGGPDGG